MLKCLVPMVSTALHLWSGSSLLLVNPNLDFLYGKWWLALHPVCLTAKASHALWFNWLDPEFQTHAVFYKPSLYSLKHYRVSLPLKNTQFIVINNWLWRLSLTSCKCSLIKCSICNWDANNIPPKLPASSVHIKACCSSCFPISALLPGVGEEWCSCNFRRWHCNMDVSSARGMEEHVFNGFSLLCIIINQWFAWRCCHSWHLGICVRLQARLEMHIRQKFYQT